MTFKTVTQVKFHSAVVMQLQEQDKFHSAILKVRQETT